MKKIFLSLLIFAASVNIFAVNYTAKVTVKITDNNGWMSSMILAESPDGTLYAQVNEENTATMYAKYDGKKCEQLRLATLGELPIGFKITVNAATLKVTAASGSALYLKDLTNDSIMELSLNREYAFTIENAQIAQFVENRFQLVVPSIYPRDVTDGNWGTLCLPWASVAVEGAEMFTVAGKDAATPTGIYVQEYANNLVAGQPYVFKATDSKLKVYYFPATGAAAGSANGLVGSLTEQTIAAGMYIIDDNQLKNTDGTCKVRENGAYFDFSKMSIYTPQPGAPVRFMSIRGISTDLEAAKAADMKEGKMIINGQLIIVKDGKMFNAQGAAL